jgi:hypothetical protein
MTVEIFKIFDDVVNLKSDKQSYFRAYHVQNLTSNLKALLLAFTP